MEIGLKLFHSRGGFIVKVAINGNRRCTRLSLSFGLIEPCL